MPDPMLSVASPACVSTFPVRAGGGAGQVRQAARQGRGREGALPHQGHREVHRDAPRHNRDQRGL